jgi:hypothetical protein
MRKTFAVAVVLLLAPGVAAAEKFKCPTPGADGVIVFPDKSFLMKTNLEVNPDGAAASYTPGDHGHTYIANGVNIILDGEIKGCKAPENQCRAKWIEAEAKGFAKGTAEFCVFAIEIEPLAPGAKTVICGDPDDGRLTAGNGKGGPAMGANVLNVLGQSVPAYLSTTRLRHVVKGKTVYVDSASIPGLVAPKKGGGSLVGSIAWVRYGKHETFAIVSDTGPSFGEGSVALHQILHTGAVGPKQPIGPIPLDKRCSKIETDLALPFVPKPDDGDEDLCKAGHKPTSPADIRAYSGIGKDVFSIIIPNVKPSMEGTKVKTELTTALLTKTATDAGYTTEKLRTMAACLK